ncbi:winged helix-turn-helix transcriptional regulator [Sphaerisporangium corydalis]|uniref:Winged helix-turn-helix transcriptional regulator n=1 Tax=Sphaerisporangium corydalis TaxID=1441875 RepID=A0ABV9E597_9ACTN|nr:helix-turn-helix domain-containing protein [Sphaerisporangium corydalis]
MTGRAGGAGVVPEPGALVHPPDRPTLLPEGHTNAVGLTLGLVGDEWNLLILRYALLGVRRYGEWRAALPISHAVLTRRLAHLTEMAIFERVGYEGTANRFEYRLSRRGRDLWPILLSIWGWESAWVPSHGESLPRMLHRRCGREFLPVLTCAACRRPVRPRDVVGGFGPSGTWERSVPMATTRRRSGPTGEAGAGMFPETMALIGNRWSAAILGGAFQGLHRFRDFEQRLGAPPTIVAERLRVFCELGVFEQTPSAERSDWLSYHLTDKGRAFFPVVISAIDWGQRWFTAPEGPALLYTHRPCGHPFHTQLTCATCTTPLRGNEITARHPS